ncbi:MAG: hypothetical protein Q9160_001351 [Pyrenula sp. 1 TL-2023]
MANIVDNNSEYCMPFIVSRLKAHNEKHAQNPNPPPFFLGMNGVQGAGKTVLVSQIKSALESPPSNLPTAVFSLDDLYLKHSDQLSLAHSHPDNPLLQHRGQPSTHDVALGLSVVSSFHQNQPTKIPQYNKAAFNGQGDRSPESEWEEVNQPGDPPIRVVIFEGWAVGFRPLDDEDLRLKWSEALAKVESGDYLGRLGYNRLEDVMDINEALRSYDEMTNQLDALIHTDAADPQYVYKWRLEQEQSLRESKGSGMTDEQVKEFVDGYYPSYELFTDTLRDGIFGDEKEKQLRLVLNKNRKVLRVLTI